MPLVWSPATSGAPTPTPEDVPAPPRPPRSTGNWTPEEATWGLEWTDTNGTVWWLSSPEGQVRLLAGHTGLLLPPRTVRIKPYTTIAGGFYRGTQVLPREVFLPLQLNDTNADAHLTLTRLFFRGLNSDQQGRLAFRRTNGTTRYLWCRYTGGGEWTADDSGYGVTWSRHGLTFTAEQPYWEGEPVTLTFSDATNIGLFIPATWPFFKIGPYASLDNAVLNNPGDVEAWPIIRATGPFTRVTLTGADGGLIDIPLTMTTGQWIELDTRPGIKTVIDHTGVNRRADVLTYKPFPIPAGSNTTLALTVSGRGSGTNVTVTFTPHHATPL